MSLNITSNLKVVWEMSLREFEESFVLATAADKIKAEEMRKQPKEQRANRAWVDMGQCRLVIEVKKMTDIYKLNDDLQELRQQPENGSL